MKLQYALDFLGRQEALSHAELGVDAGAHAIEAGHLLIKICGLGIVGELRDRHPQAEIVADMKTMDMGAAEVRAAASAGAHTVIVCGAASDGMVQKAVETAQEVGVALLVSLMGVQNRVARSRQLVDLGAPTILAHIGNDDAFRWSDPGPRAELDDLLGMEAAIALAGGIDSESVSRYPVGDLERIVVGRGISSAPDPAGATRSLVRSIESSAVGVA